jgi:uncharacterized protein (TIGR00369 family)
MPASVPPVPYFELLRMLDASSEDGSSACEMEVGGWLAGMPPLGIHTAVTGFADCVLSYAAIPRGSKDQRVTLGLHVDFWRPPPAVGTRLTGTAELQSEHGPAALVLGRLLDGDQVLATASLRSMVVSAPLAASTSAPTAARPRAVPDPPVAADHPNQPLLAPDVERVLDLSREAIGATHLTLGSDGTGAVSMHLVPPPQLERTTGVVHGGAVVNIAQLASAASAQSVLPAGVYPRRLSATIDYLRPTLVGEALVATATVAHRSRRVLLVNVELRGADGRPTARFADRCVTDQT